MKTTIGSELQDKGDIIFEFTFVALELFGIVSPKEFEIDCVLLG